MMYTAEEQPSQISVYLPALASSAASSIGTVIGPYSSVRRISLATSYALICIWQNKANEKAIAAGRFALSAHVLSEGLLDITDREKQDFRYS